MGHVLFLRKGEVHTKPIALPVGYTRLAYIQSSGTQYVDTGFVPNQDTQFILDCERVTSNSADHFFGVRTGTSAKEAFCLYIYNSGWRFAYNDHVAAYNGELSKRNLIDSNKNITTINESLTLTGTYAKFTASASALLFAMRSVSSGISYGEFRLYFCQIYDNGTLVRDYIPCINASGAVGLYDLVGKQFYGNAGTGVFTGSEVV